MSQDISNFAKDQDDLGTQLAAFASSIGGTSGQLDVTRAPYLADSTGSTDASAAINQAITDAAASGKSIFIPPGSYMLTSPVIPANGVSVIGAGPTSVIKPTGAISAISLVGSIGSPLTDCVFRDFKIDGAGQTGGYAVGTKGIFIQYLLRCLFANVQIHNCIATGLGIDFLVDCTIANCNLKNNGRLWTAGQSGGAGIGIGTGSSAGVVESYSIVGNHCEGNGSYGIFEEAQITTAYTVFGSIVGNTCQGSKKAGIGGGGGQGMSIVGNTCNGNGTAGTGTNTANILLDLGTLTRGGSSYTIVANNVAINGLSHGILVVGNASSGTPRRLRISNNVVALNGSVTAGQDGHGIFLNGSQHSLNDFTVSDNEVALNQASGIILASGTGHTNIAIRNNDCYGNGRAAGGGNTQDGINVSGASVTGLTIMGNQCYDTTTFQITGINLVAGSTLANARISNNDLRGNVTNTMLVNATLSGVGNVFKDNAGFNPVGVVTVAVPATGVAVAASQYDRTFYITAGASTCTCAISGGPSPVIPSGAFASIRVPAGQTLTPTYASAPTWVVEAE